MAGAVLGAAAGNLYCQRALRQRRDLEDRLRVVVAEEMAASAAGGGGTGGSGGETVPEAVETSPVEGRGVRLELGDALLFAPGSDRLAAPENPDLDAVAASLVETPASQIAIVGHTGDTEEADANLALSERRAQTVASYLEARGVTADRVASVGKGETEPPIAGTTPEARATNRRVEVLSSRLADLGSSRAGCRVGFESGGPGRQRPRRDRPDATSRPVCGRDPQPSDRAHDRKQRQTAYPSVQATRVPRPLA